MFCPCCRQSQPAYLPLTNTLNGVCAACGSYHRHRLLLLYLEQQTDLHTRREPTRLLHVAPEPAIARHLRGFPGIRYASTDRCASGYDYAAGSISARSDIVALPFPDDVFDVILCNHVFEHILDERAAMREVHRVLRRDGWAILMVPLTENPETYEDASITDPEQRTMHYGQFDHVRLYGEDYPRRLQEAGFEVSMIDYAAQFDAEETRRFGILQGFDDTIVLCRKRAAPAT